jgi:predicted Zn-dependent protease
VERGHPLTRVLAAAAALLVAGWLAVGLRATLLEERADEQLTVRLALDGRDPARAGALSQAARDLDDAGWLNPDRLPRMYRAQILVALGHEERARAIAREVTRAEPDNLEIWRTALGMALALPDRGLEAEARRRIAELNPRLSR